MSGRPLGILLAIPLATAASADSAVPEPEAYRMEDYRAPVPETLQGALVLDTAVAYTVWLVGEAVFVDVLPRPPKPDLPEGTLWRPPKRLGIPGGIWLPNTGFGALAPDTQAYFERELARASDGDLDRPLVFYCLRDCWMSWNAAKRALALGHAAVAWYPDGTDGWSEAGFPLEESEPVPARQ